MAERKQYGAGQIIAGSAVFCAFVGVMVVQKIIPGGEESMGMTLAGVAVGFVSGLVGAIAYVRRRSR